MASSTSWFVALHYHTRRNVHNLLHVPQSHHEVQEDGLLSVMVPRFDEAYELVSEECIRASNCIPQTPAMFLYQQDAYSIASTRMLFCGVCTSSNQLRRRASLGQDALLRYLRNITPFWLCRCRYSSATRRNCLSHCRQHPQCDQCPKSCRWQPDIHANLGVQQSRQR